MAQTDEYRCPLCRGDVKEAFVGADHEGYTIGEGYYTYAWRCNSCGQEFGRWGSTWHDWDVGKISPDFSTVPANRAPDAELPKQGGVETAKKAFLFLCHASEDKPVALDLASFLLSRNVSVWLDHWEIGVGDSIVGKIDQGLAVASHVAILISKNSVSKPWVTKEISSVLMRQLADQTVRILPVRLDDAPLPVILADIHYADCRSQREHGFEQVFRALTGSTVPQ